MPSTAAYRPPPPAPSAYFAMQFNPNASSHQLASPSTFLCRVPSKHSIQQFPDPVAQPSPFSSNASTRSSSAASIAALPSLSNSLNNLANMTSMEQVALTGTRAAAEGEEMLRRLVQSNSKRLSSSTVGASVQQEQNRFIHYDDSDESDSDSDDVDDAYSRAPQSARQAPPAALPHPSHHHYQSESRAAGLMMSRSKKGKSFTTH